jgi:signal transduction histidine kinase
VRVEESEGEASVVADPYWLSVCIRNLVDNALEHGRPPVVVRVRADAKAVRCSVTDAGRPAFASLQELARPFAKSGSSRGLGLGLTITRHTIRAMGGELTFRPDPSTFTLSMGRAP